MRTVSILAAFSTVLALAGLLTACGKGPTEPTPLRNHLPVGGTVTVTPTAVGMAGVTTFSFDSNASDEDTDQLIYSWNFGDGGTGTGKTPTHVYTETGTFNVTLSVSDGKESVSATGISVTVAPSITGTWTGGFNPFFNCGLSFTATQDGSALTGSFSFTADTAGCRAALPVTLASGSVDPLTHPSTVTWTSNTFSFSFLPSSVISENLSLRFNGTTNTGGNSVSGTIQTLRGGVLTRTSSTTFTK